MLLPGLAAARRSRRGDPGGAVQVASRSEPRGDRQPTVSHHLKVLREAGLVEVARKRGTWVYYRLVPAAVAELAFALGGPTERAVA